MKRKTRGWLTPHKAPCERAAWRKVLYIIIFGSDTPGGKRFDVALLISILLSIFCVTLESVPTIRALHPQFFFNVEWFFTLLFSIEYILRVVSSPRPLKYMTSFFGVIDLLSIIPSFLSLRYAGSQGLIVVRVFRLLRVFRIFKLATYFRESKEIMSALYSRGHKITVFIVGILTLIVIMGACMYLIEGPASGFTSIPTSMYWAVVTLTTVGYGDITPLTPAGKIMASAIMLLGYGIIAVPTSIVTAEIGRAAQAKKSRLECPRCGEANHLAKSRYCCRCGESIIEKRIDPVAEI